MVGAEDVVASAPRASAAATENAEGQGGGGVVPFDDGAGMTVILTGGALAVTIEADVDPVDVTHRPSHGAADEDDAPVLSIRWAADALDGSSTAEMAPLAMLVPCDAVFFICCCLSHRARCLPSDGCTSTRHPPFSNASIAPFMRSLVTVTV